MVEYVFIPPNARFSDEAIARINELLHQLSKKAKPIDRTRLEDVAHRSWLLVAMDHDLIIGLAILVPINILNGYLGRIEDVVVDKTYRSQGIGRQLTGQLLAKASEQGMEHVELTSRAEREAANRLYRSMGFQMIATNVYRLYFE
jgi:ribosomal protein S18 acetylase RimI-like enzyme